MVLLSPNLPPPLFMDTQEQPLEISIEWRTFFIAYNHILPIIVLNGFKNKSACIQVILGAKTLTAHLSYNIIRGKPPSFLAILHNNCHRSAVVGSQSVPFSGPSTPPPPPRLLKHLPQSGGSSLAPGQSGKPLHNQWAGIMPSLRVSLQNTCNVSEIKQKMASWNGVFNI